MKEGWEAWESDFLEKKWCNEGENASGVKEWIVTMEGEGRKNKRKAPPKKKKKSRRRRRRRRKDKNGGQNSAPFVLTT